MSEEALVWKIHGASLWAVLEPVSSTLAVIAGFVFEAGNVKTEIRPEKGLPRYVLVPEVDDPWPERLKLPDRFEWGDIAMESQGWRLKLRQLSLRWEGDDLVGLRCVSESIRDGKGWALLVRPVLLVRRGLLHEAVIPTAAVAFSANRRGGVDVVPIPLPALGKLIRREIGEVVKVSLYFEPPSWRLDI